MQYESFAGLVFGLAMFATSAVAAYINPNILTIEGQQRDILAQYSIARLRSDFQNVVIETRTPWTKEGETVRFRGPRISEVLRRHGMDSAESVNFVAYDNFTSEILLKEIETYQPIFAIDRACMSDDVRSGKCKSGQDFTPLSPQEQGPIFLVWPYEQLPAAYVPARNSIWVWFVVAVRPAE